MDTKESGIIYYWSDGVLVHGEWPSCAMQLEWCAPFHLTIADPPYGDIVAEDWDQTNGNTVAFVDNHIKQTKAIYAAPGCTLYWFGGYGKPNVRPWYEWVLRIESETNWRMAMHLTWSKKRAYGVQHNYLSTREEIAYCVLGDIKKPRVFNVPLLNEKRGYDGYNLDYPAKSEFKRRTAVWTDITEIFRGKVHPTQKPDELYKVIVNTSSNPGDTVFDPFAGSGVTGVVCRELGRKFVLVEREQQHVSTILNRLGTPSATASY